MKKGMIIWIAVSVLAAAGLGLVLYNKSKKNKGADTDDTDDDDDDAPKDAPKSVYTKFSQTNVRKKPVVDNGTLGIGHNKIGTVAPNTLIGKKISSVVGSDDYTWYQVQLASLPEFDGVKTGFVRSDVVNLK